LSGAPRPGLGPISTICFLVASGATAVGADANHTQQVFRQFKLIFGCHGILELLRVPRIELDNFSTLEQIM